MEAWWFPACLVDLHQLLPWVRLCFKHLMFCCVAVLYLRWLLLPCKVNLLRRHNACCRPVDHVRLSDQSVLMSLRLNKTRPLEAGVLTRRLCYVQHVSTNLGTLHFQAFQELPTPGTKYCPWYGIYTAVQLGSAECILVRKLVLLKMYKRMMLFDAKLLACSQEFYICFFKSHSLLHRSSCPKIRHLGWPACTCSRESRLIPYARSTSTALLQRLDQRRILDVLSIKICQLCCNTWVLTNQTFKHTDRYARIVLMHM